MLRMRIYRILNGSSASVWTVSSSLCLLLLLPQTIKLVLNPRTAFSSRDNAIHPIQRASQQPYAVSCSHSSDNHRKKQLALLAMS
jgi:hypothetical protein